MAKPNYSYEKRQRDIAKKNKKEQKRQRKNGPETAAEDSFTPTSSDIIDKLNWPAQSKE